MHRDGETLRLTLHSTKNIRVQVVSPDLSPLKLDKRISGLKRVEINCPASVFPGKQGMVGVRLSGE